MEELQQAEEYIYNLEKPYINLVLAAIGAIAGWLLHFIAFSLLGARQKWREGPVNTELRQRMRMPMLLFLPLLGIMTALYSSPDRLQYHYFNKSLLVLLILVGCWTAMRLVTVFEQLLYRAYSLKKENNFKERKIYTQVQFMKRLFNIAIVIIGIALILLSFERLRSLGATLLTSAGIAGLIIGVAAQKTLSNFLAGMQIAFTQPIKIDDAVVVEGEFGVVEEINLTYVVIKLWDWRRQILPITYFVDKPFQNWTRSKAEIIGNVVFFVDFRLPVPELRAHILSLLKHHPKWDGEVAVLQVVDATEQSMKLRALMSAPSPSDAWDLRCYMREAIFAYISKNYPEYLPRVRAELPNKNDLQHSII
jgi:small-conductance mechanosensitive channel